MRYLAHARRVWLLGIALTDGGAAAQACTWKAASTMGQLRSTNGRSHVVAAAASMGVSICAGLWSRSATRSASFDG